jgi:hypothetical protein
MNLSEIIRLLVNLITIITIFITVVIVGLIVRKRKDLAEEFGVSGKLYLFLVFSAEVIYTVGLMLILSALGVNVLVHLQNLGFAKFMKTIHSADLAKVKFTSTLGWVGLVLNCSIAFLAPGYLLVKGGKRLPKLIRYSALTEIILELVVISLVVISFCLG